MTCCLFTGQEMDSSAGEFLSNLSFRLYRVRNVVAVVDRKIWQARCLGRNALTALFKSPEEEEKTCRPVSWKLGKKGYFVIERG